MKARARMLRDRWHSLQDYPGFRRWLGLGSLLLSVSFMLILLARGGRELNKRGTWDAYLLPVAHAFLLYPLSLSLQALTWSLIIERMAGVRSRWRDIQIYTYSHFMRRLPGSLWYLVGRTAGYREWGIDASVPLAASALEWLLLLLAATAIFAGLSVARLNFLPASPGMGLAVYAGLMALGVEALSLLGRGRTPPRWLPVRLRDALASLRALARPRRRDLALWSGMYSLAYGIGGLILYVLARGIAPDAPLTLVHATQAWALSGGIDFLASMIVPASLGIREATVTAMLAPQVPPVAGLLAAVLLRLVFLLGDLLWGGLMWGLARWRAHKKP